MNDATPYGFPQLGGPYKCPDCGIWWAGYEHRCKVNTVNTNTIKITHCHGCISAYCILDDHVPCMEHAGGWTTSDNVPVSSL